MPDDRATNEPRRRARELGIPLGRFKPGPLERHHRRRRREGRPHDHHRGAAGPLKVGQGAGAHRRHRHPPERGEHLQGARRRRRLRAQRRRRGLGASPRSWSGGSSRRRSCSPTRMSVGEVSDAAVKWMVERYPGIGDEHDVIIPVVGECDDSWLNDIAGPPRARGARHARRCAPRADGPVAGGQRRRRHRHDHLRLQGRHRHRVAQAARRCSAATPSACW